MEKQINLEDINLKFITKGGAVKMISWGKDYRKWPVEKQLEYAEALASSMNEACELIQNERNECLEKIKYLEKTLEETDKAIENQRNNNVNSITKSNADKQELIKTIRQLENELKVERIKNEVLK